jgi:hypothetical protein
MYIGVVVFQYRFIFKGNGSKPPMEQSGAFPRRKQLFRLWGHFGGLNSYIYGSLGAGWSIIHILEAVNLDGLCSRPHLFLTSAMKSAGSLHESDGANQIGCELTGMPMLAASLVRINALSNSSWVVSNKANDLVGRSLRRSRNRV